MQTYFEANGNTVSYKGYTGIVFAADGFGSQLTPTVTRSTVTEDSTALKCFNHCVDLVPTYGTEARKTRTKTLKSLTASYLVFYNLSPKLQVNQTLARLMDFKLGDSARLFWRGDVVVMRADLKRDPRIKCLDASKDDIARVQALLVDEFNSRSLEEQLSLDEQRWNSYCNKHCQSWFSYQRKAEKFWGANPKQQEAEALNDINELRALLEQPPLPPHPYMGSPSRLITNMVSSWVPKLPTRGRHTPYLDTDSERLIFEMCAKDDPRVCLKLMLVARRVKLWVYPIFYQVIDFDYDDSSGERKSCHRARQFYANNLLKPALPLDFYALHVKSLWIPLMSTEMKDTQACTQILATCRDVENLAIFTPTSFLENPGAGHQLRRLTTNLQYLCVHPTSYGGRKVWPFDHTCFANLTHLHLHDSADDWPTYRGWEKLRSLTHLALVYPGSPGTVTRLLDRLPHLLYVAVGHYKMGKGRTSINYDPRMLAAWPMRVVWLSQLTADDWNSGARGGVDMWSLVEREAALRLAQTIENRNQEP